MLRFELLLLIVEANGLTGVAFEAVAGSGASVLTFDATGELSVIRIKMQISPNQFNNNKFLSAKIALAEKCFNLQCQ